MGLENVLNSELDEASLKIQTCVGEDDHGHQQPRDYSSYLNALAIYRYLCKLKIMKFTVNLSNEITNIC